MYELICKKRKEFDKTILKNELKIYIPLYNSAAARKKHLIFLLLTFLAGSRNN